MDGERFLGGTFNQSRKQITNGWKYVYLDILFVIPVYSPVFQDGVRRDQVDLGKCNCSVTRL